MDFYGDITDQVTLALYAILFIGSLGIAVASFVCARKRDDPARSWTTFFKFACCLFAISYALVVCIESINLVLDTTGGFSMVKYYSYLKATSAMSTLAKLYIVLAQAAMFAGLISLANGILVSRSVSLGGRSRIFKLVCYGASVVVGILALASWATKMSILVPEYQKFDRDADDDDDEYAVDEDDDDDDSLLNRWNDVYRLEFAIQVLIVILALVALARAIQVWRRVSSSANKASKTPLIYLLVCCMLFLMHTVFEMSITAAYTNFADFTRSTYIPWASLYYIHIILTHYALLVVLVLQFVLAVKRANGVWSGEDAAVVQPSYY